LQFVSRRWKEFFLSAPEYLNRSGAQREFFLGGKADPECVFDFKNYVIKIML
jgi:hypothetical protein